MIGNYSLGKFDMINLAEYHQNASCVTIKILSCERKQLTVSLGPRLYSWDDVAIGSSGGMQAEFGRRDNCQLNEKL